MAAKIRVHELAKELGLTNREALDLCSALEIPVKSHSSSIEDAQADRVRRRIERERLAQAKLKPRHTGDKQKAASRRDTASRRTTKSRHTLLERFVARGKRPAVLCWAVTLHKGTIEVPRPIRSMFDSAECLIVSLDPVADNLTPSRPSAGHFRGRELRIPNRHRIAANLERKAGVRIYPVVDSAVFCRGDKTPVDSPVVVLMKSEQYLTAAQQVRASVNVEELELAIDYLWDAGCLDQELEDDIRRLLNRLKDELRNREPSKAVVAFVSVGLASVFWNLTSSAIWDQWGRALTYSVQNLLR